MTKDISKLKKEFKRIKSLGFVENNRPNSKDGGIGNTFEDYLNVVENNRKDPDFDGIEIKSQRFLTESYVSLFSKSPSFPKKANRYLKDTFGRADSHFPDLKVLHSSVFGHRWNSLYDNYKLKIVVDKFNEKLILIIADKNENILSDNVCWTFEHLRKACKKLDYLFVVVAESKKENGTEFFHYQSGTAFLDFKFEKFLDALHNGTLMFDIRMGAYKSGKNYGKFHDHGSGFRIKRENIFELFEQVFEVE